MYRHGLIGLLFAVIMSAPALGAGLKIVTVPADASGPAIKVAVWYPSADKPSPVAFGSLTVLAAQDGSIAGQGLPLVVLSHGRGGSFVGHHDTDEHLADAGFVVAAINHPGDNATDKSLFYDLSIYRQRPLDVKRVIDYVTGAAPWATAIDPNRIGIYGFSRGGYTALVAIGADPDFALAVPLCDGRTDKVCNQIRAQDYPKEPLTHDRRIKAAVIADPLSVFFTTEDSRSHHHSRAVMGLGEGRRRRGGEDRGGAQHGAEGAAHLHQGSEFAALFIPGGLPAEFCRARAGHLQRPAGSGPGSVSRAVQQGSYRVFPRSPVVKLGPSIRLPLRFKILLVLQRDRSLFPGLRFQEQSADLRPVHPSQFTSPIGEALGVSIALDDLDPITRRLARFLQQDQARQVLLARHAADDAGCGCRCGPADDRPKAGHDGAWRASRRKSNLSSCGSKVPIMCKEI